MISMTKHTKEEGKDMGMPEGKGAWTATVGTKGQIVIPAKARKIFDIKTGDRLFVLGDEGEGLAIIKEEKFLFMAEMIRKASEK